MKKSILTTILCLSGVIALLGTVCSEAAAQQKYDLNVGASATSGMSYRWVVPMCEIVNKYSDFVTLHPITTTGSTENVNLIVNGEAEIGVGPASTVSNAINGRVDWEGKPVTGIEYIYYMFPDYFNVYLPANSPVNSMEDLKGKTISIGETGSGGYTNSLASLNAMGYSLSDFNVLNISLADGCEAITEGWLDCMIYYGSPLNSSVLAMQASPVGLKMIEMTEDEVAKAIAADPVFRPRTIVDSYEGIPPLRSFGGSTAVFGREDIPDEVTYEIVRIIDEHLDELIAALPSANISTLENTVDAVTIVPMAGGTAKYLREKGLLP